MTGNRVISLVLAMATLASVFSLCFAEAPVTLETLTSLRAQERVARKSYDGGVDEQGQVYLVEQEGTNEVDASVALGRAFSVPFCWEFGGHATGILFPFVIEPNQRLVDVLDAMKEASEGFAQWRLLHGRIIVTYRQPSGDDEVHAMDRLISVDLEARTWREAIVQIESAYNTRYHDAPLIMEVSCPGKDDCTPILANQQEVTIVLGGEMTLREAVLSLLDRLGDPWAVYDTGAGGGKKERHYSVTIRLSDAQDEFQSGEEYTRFQQVLQERKERLQTYLDRNEALAQEAAAKAAPSDGEK